MSELIQKFETDPSLLPDDLGCVYYFNGRFITLEETKPDPSRVIDQDDPEGLVRLEDIPKTHREALGWSTDASWPSDPMISLPKSSRST